MIDQRLLKDLKNYRGGKTLVEDNDFIKNQTEHKPVAYTLGSIPFDSFKKVIEEVDLEKVERIIVGGCSQGWLCFYWNSLYPEKSAIGLDIHPLRVEYGNKLIEKYNIKNVTLNLCDYKEFEFEDGDLLWLNDAVFPDSRDTSIKILEKYPSLQIVSMKMPPRINGKYKAKRVEAKSEWSYRCRFFIY